MDASDELLRTADPAALLSLDGAIRSLNIAMTTVLDRSANRCLGRKFSELWPASQRILADSLVVNAANAKTVAMRVLQFPGHGGESVACLMEARPVQEPTSGQGLVWLHALDAGNDLASLLIPFRLATEAADLGLWTYSPDGEQFEWLGGLPSFILALPDLTGPLPRIISAVHPDDQEPFLRLLRSGSAQSSWVTLRCLNQHGGWHQLSAQTRRIRLGYGGPERIFGLVRDDTQQVKRKRKAQAALAAERKRAKEIADLSSALITAATEQELQQVVLTRLAATFGASGALLALVHEDRLQVSTDAGITMWEVEAFQGMRLDHPTPLPEAIRTGKPRFIPDRSAYIRHWPRAVAYPPLAQLGPDYAVSITPLSEPGNQPLGGWVMTYGSGYRPSLDERTLMGTVADLAGQALRRIRLQQARVDLASALQETMLPTLPEELPGLEVAARYRPSRDGLDIGGDWYDAFVMLDGAIALEIGDVQGHDVDAAAFMGQVRLSMRAIAAQEPDPGAVLTRTNELLVSMSPARFASCTILHVDPRDGRVIGTSAGHVPVLCAHGDGSHDIVQLPGGPVLGVVRGTEYGEDVFDLDEDSALILVTDGAVEGPSLTLDAGLERVGTRAAKALRDGMNSEEIADRILAAAVAVDHVDDVAVLVIRRT
ncbi:SpoIIE family protein phosphatase [Actinacidiphila glaucinigra]|uniref:Serine phosphatase RsbU, regulator of sigma subunit n=1 Tax=Actinacidiphila glaucinigra TaxID=235986 RepID=A0A239JR57_9ACTN|nr:SpoIIE family protein phosphatase [Actinacidiphila glaucinigra]SNT07843.1 Serine phosphatase RsbU, regulator of sigma subunit [Actinacidiphila glaucinigra]